MLKEVPFELNNHPSSSRFLRTRVTYVHRLHVTNVTEENSKMANV
jgi:hypothetical protein